MKDIRSAYPDVIALLRSKGMEGRPISEQALKDALRQVCGITDPHTARRHMGNMQSDGFLTWSGMEQRFRLTPTPPPAYIASGTDVKAVRA